MDQNPPDQEILIGKYKIKILRSTCIGAASCVAISPTVFNMDSANKAVFLENPTDAIENLLLAAQSCPTKAIIVTDTETGQQLWPK